MRWLQKLAEFSLRNVYFPVLGNLVVDTLSKQPGEVGLPDDINIGDSDSMLCMLQDPIVFAEVEDWLKVVAPHLVLTGCMEAMKTVLSSCGPLVALALKRCSRQHLDHGEYAH